MHLRKKVLKCTLIPTPTSSLLSSAMTGCTSWQKNIPLKPGKNMMQITPLSVSAPAGQQRMKMLRHWFTISQHCKQNIRWNKRHGLYHAFCLCKAQKSASSKVFGGNLVKNTERHPFSTANFLSKCKGKSLDRMGKLLYNS